MKEEAERIVTAIIQKGFDLPNVVEDDGMLEKIRGLLIDKLNFLLNHDFEKLLWILYRIDVNEEKVKEVLAIQSEEKPSELLADLIIERQMEKAKTRMQYKSDEGDL